ncbi:hypothetical protein [Mesorhizobium sp. LCM 4577]|uniref:hypothetical protein n=1 Tax=Mesorhizobium sp. LCM 4577 TaxID=1848288 RepID=UPI0010424943|nr:hypothetical protein [Mesorhizobium sp. LCM 4577]
MVKVPCAGATRLRVAPWVGAATMLSVALTSRATTLRVAGDDASHRALIDHWHKSQRSEKLIGATPYATHTLHWSSQVKTAGHPRKISHATAQ